MLHLNIDNAGIDAMLITKKEAVPAFAAIHEVPLERIAAIGDGTHDLPFMLTSGLGLVGAPANSQDKVKEAVSKLPNGYVSEKHVLDAFFEFYDLAAKRGITHIISDRDGVLVWERKYDRGEEFYERIAKGMGVTGPLVSVLTGSSISQNEKFRQAYGLDERLKNNQSVIHNPHLLLAENGSAQLDVLSGDVLNYSQRLDPELLEFLKGDFQEDVLDEIGDWVLPRYGFSFSDDYYDQDAKVYIPPKISMVTVNVPSKDRNGEKFRKTQAAKDYSEDVMSVMISSARRNSIPYARMDQ